VANRSKTDEWRKELNMSRIRYRHWVALVAAVALVTLSTVAVTLAKSPPNDRNTAVVAASPPETTQGEAAPPNSDAPPRPQDPSNCRNSYDPACGEFYWQAEPGPNQPLAVDVDVAPQRAKVGEPVTFTVVARDPDLRIDRECVVVKYGDMTGEVASCEVFTCLKRHGPWTPPQREPDRVERIYTHTFTESGTYNVAFIFKSKVTTCFNPYESEGTGSMTIQVTS
jgi:hypothetical protein